MANRFLSNKVRNRNHIRIGTKKSDCSISCPNGHSDRFIHPFQIGHQSTVSSESEIAIIQHACIVRFRSICVCFRCDPICRNRLKRPCKIKTKASPDSSDKKRVFYRLDRFSYICSQRIPICTNCQKAKHTKFALFPAYIIFAGRG